ncbi:MAG: glucosaminidase domain-containing protein [Bacteroidota bacterium]
MTIKTVWTFAIALIFVHTINAQKEVHEAYIEKYKALAVKEMERSGVPASITIAQGILESDAGRSELAVHANNHFGIKVSGNWYGGFYQMEDDEYDENGKILPSYFRTYPNVAESFKDHSQFLKKDRYSRLFKLRKTDYKGWAKGLQQAGYATNKSYSKILISLIERYDLNDYDRMSYSDFNIPEETELIAGVPVPKEEEKEEKKETNPFSADASVNLEEALFDNENEAKLVSNTSSGSSENLTSNILIKNDVKYVVSIQTETVEEIAKRIHYTTGELLRYNEHLTGPTQNVAPGVVVFIQPKRKSYRGKASWHQVGEGESMLDISNLYAIDLKELYRRNIMIQGQEPRQGERIKIRGKEVSKPPKFNEPGKAPVATFGQLVPNTSDVDFGNPVKVAQPENKLEDPFGNVVSSNPASLDPKPEEMVPYQKKEVEMAPRSGENTEEDNKKKKKKKKKKKPMVEKSNLYRRR